MNACLPLPGCCFRCCFIPVRWQGALASDLKPWWREGVLWVSWFSGPTSAPVWQSWATTWPSAPHSTSCTGWHRRLATRLSSSVCAKYYNTTKRVGSCGVTTAVSSLIGAAPGRGSCPIQRPLTFDLIYTDYHGLAHLHGAMGLAFKHYQYDSSVFLFCFVFC